MVTKAFLNEAMRTYDENRSFFRVGLFHYAVDYISPITQLYYQLRTFIRTDLAELRSEDQLNPGQIRRLRSILDQNYPGPNSTNSEICDLHDTISNQLPDNIEHANAQNSNIMAFALRYTSPTILTQIYFLLFLDYQPLRTHTYTEADLTQTGTSAPAA